MGRPLDDVGRQLARIRLPLFGRVVLDERLVQRPADEGYPLVVEVLGIRVGELAGLLLDQRLRLGWRVVRMEELVDRAQVDGQRVDLAVVRGVHAMHIVGELGEAVHILPHARIGGVEQVGSVLVDLGAGFLV